jgi:tetratricopeptide (TPR) repeat protein
VRHALYGLGGIGKTQLAAEYCYRTADEYAIVWWLRADSAELLDLDYRRLGLALGVQLPGGTTAERQIELIRVSLESKTKVLLVFDDARDFPEIRNYLLQRGSGIVLITTQNPDWSGQATVHDVGAFRRADSIEFLAKRLSRPADAIGEDLPRELGDLPLALEQAGAYISETSIKITEYLDLFHRRRSELWSVEQAPQDYHSKVNTTWTLAFDRVAQEHPAASVLFSILCCFDSSQIPRFLIEAPEQSILEEFPADIARTEAVRFLSDTLIRNKVLSAFRRYSLIQLNEDFIFVHRLVQLVAFDAATDVRRVNSANLAMWLLIHHMPERFETRVAKETAGKLVPHLKAAIARTSGLAVEARFRAMIMNLLGLFLDQFGELAEAEKYLRDALSLIEDQMGRKHRLYFAVANNLAIVLRTRGNFREARQLFDKVVGHVVRDSTWDKPNIAQVFTNFGQLFDDLGEFRTAKKQHERALSIAQDHFGTQHPALSLFLNNLALSMKNLGEFREALELFRRAFELEVEAYGPEHPGLLTLRNNIGMCLRELDELQAAMSEYRAALPYAEAWYGERSQLVASICHNMAVVHNDLGDLPRARECAEKSVAADEAVYGLNHVEVAKDLDTLVEVLDKQGEKQLAEQSAVRAFHIMRQGLGVEHWLTRHAATRFASVRSGRTIVSLLRTGFTVQIDDHSFQLTPPTSH